MPLAHLCTDELDRAALSGEPVFAYASDLDRRSDACVKTTVRGLVRLMIVSADAGARFAGRDENGVEALEWMLVPRPLLGGRAAIDACREREGFLLASALQELTSAPGLPSRQEEPAGGIVEWALGMTAAESLAFRNLVA